MNAVPSVAIGDAKRERASPTGSIQDQNRSKATPAIEIKGQNLYSTIGIDYAPCLKTGIYHPSWKRKDEKHDRRFYEEKTKVTDKTVYVSKVVVGSEKATYQTMVKSLGPVPAAIPDSAPGP